MRHETATEIDRLVQEVVRSASSTVEECRKTSPETALQLWTSHVAHLLSALSDVVISLWREHPDLVPKGPIREQWDQFHLSREATELCRRNVGELRRLVADVAKHYEAEAGPVNSPHPGLVKAKQELDRMEEYLSSSVAREELP
jgi:hypothetical protein